MCLSPISFNHIAVGSADSHIRIYDRRYLKTTDMIVSTGGQHTMPLKTFTIPVANVSRPYRITSLNYSADECQLLVSYSSEHLYLLDVTRTGLNSVDALQTKRGENVKRLVGPLISGSAADSQSATAPATATPSVRRLRLRGDWSDTGPEARPERDVAARVTIGQARPQLQATIMHRMTEVLSRMLADPRTRIGLGGVHGEAGNDELDVQQIAAAAASTNESGSTVTAAAESEGNSELRTTVESMKENEQQRQESGDDEPINFDYLLMKFMGHRNSR